MNINNKFNIFYQLTQLEINAQCWKTSKKCVEFHMARIALQNVQKSFWKWVSGQSSRYVWKNIILGTCI